MISIKYPDKVPTTILILKINKPVDGSKAKIKKAASPIVDVKTATKAPKEILPWMYCVTTIIAPPHPGIAPSKAAKGT